MWAALIGLLGLVTHAGTSRVTTTGTVVRRVIDGDTIELTDGRLVRYIGIDAPEVRRRARPGDREWRAKKEWVVDPEPFAREAAAANRRLVEGKPIQLEFDVQQEDRYGRALAYVYVGEQMVNEALVADGYAHVLTIPPNVRYADRFRLLANAARRARRGVWRGN